MACTLSALCFVVRIVDAFANALIGGIENGHMHRNEPRKLHRGHNPGTRLITIWLVSQTVATDSHRNCRRCNWLLRLLPVIAHLVFCSVHSSNRCLIGGNGQQQVVLQPASEVQFVETVPLLSALVSACTDAPYALHRGLNAGYSPPIHSMATEAMLPVLPTSGRLPATGSNTREHSNDEHDDEHNSTGSDWQSVD